MRTLWLLLLAVMGGFALMGTSETAPVALGAEQEVSLGTFSVARRNGGGGGGVGRGRSRGRMGK